MLELAAVTPASECLLELTLRQAPPAASKAFVTRPEMFCRCRMAHLPARAQVGQPCHRAFKDPLQQQAVEVIEDGQPDLVVLRIRKLAVVRWLWTSRLLPG